MKFESIYQELKKLELSKVELLAESLKPDEELKVLNDHIFNLSKDVYEASKIENIFFEYCPYSVYKHYYKKRLREYTEDDKTRAFTEIEFIESEIKQITFLSENFYNTNYHQDLKLGFEKKLKFLQKKKDKYYYNNDSREILDLSNTSAKEKIVFLNELKIIDFLKENSEFSTSTNRLATLLSAITGEKAETLQSYLNPMVSKLTDQKNNPYINEKLVQKVKSKIASI